MINKPTRLQLGTSRLEYLSPAALRVFLDKSWIHFGDAQKIRSWWKQRLVALRYPQRAKNIDALYKKTNFQEFYFTKGTGLPFEDCALSFILSEHFFEHLFFDEALSLFRECFRVLASGGVMRVSVPDADLRTYEPPESVGYPSTRMRFTHPNKHKTRWSIYMLGEALKVCGFMVVPVRYCDREAHYIRIQPRSYEGCTESQLICDLSYLQRPDSLIVDAIKTT